MTTIVTRASKGSPLTFTEADANFTNLKTSIDDHIVDTAGAHAASAISNVAAGNIVATTVQAAIDELDGQDTTNATATALVQTNLNTRTGTSSSSMFRNHLHNGSFNIIGRGAGPFTAATAFINNDATILLDRWRILSDGNDIVDVSQETSTIPTAPGAQTAIALDVETINKKFGIIQWVEKRNCEDLIGGNVIVSFKAKVSGTTKLDNIKCAIIAWSSTADAPTADAISAWGVEGTNPTLVANMTYENTPANLGVTTSYATYSVTAAVDTASTANIGVFIWSDVTDTTLAEFVYITDVQLEAGTVATPYERRPISVEADLCGRYLPSFLSLGAVSGLGFGVCQTTTTAQIFVWFATKTRIAVTGIAYSAATHISTTNSSFGGFIAATSIAYAAQMAHNGCLLTVNVAAGLTADSPSFAAFNSASGILVFTGAEI